MPKNHLNMPMTSFRSCQAAGPANSARTSRKVFQLRPMRNDHIDQVQEEDRRRMTTGADPVDDAGRLRAAEQLA